jgi:hypothetical protein
MNEHQGIGAAVMLVTAIGCGVVALILISIFSGSLYQNSDNLMTIGEIWNKTNESKQITNNVFHSLTFSHLQPGYIVKIFNATKIACFIEMNSSGRVCHGFEFNLSRGLVKAGNSSMSNKTFKFSYFYRNITFEDKVRSTAGYGFDSTKTLSSYMPLIAIALIIVIVLGIVLGSGVLGKSGSNGGGAL